MDGTNHNLETSAELLSLSAQLDALAREDASGATPAMLDRIVGASWTGARASANTQLTSLSFDGRPVEVSRPRSFTRESSQAIRLAAAVALLATGVAAYFGVRSSPTSTTQASREAWVKASADRSIENGDITRVDPAQVIAQAQVESDLALLDDIWGDGSTSELTSDLWASAGDIQVRVATDALDYLFSSEESTQ